MNFALIGVGGYIAPRHLEAIKDLGHQLICAFDPNDSVGIMDRYFPDCVFFTELERFEAFLAEKQRSSQPIHFISICSPNYLHVSHIKLGLRYGCNVICEKPLVLNQSDLDQIKNEELKTGKSVYTVLQLRVHEAILSLKNKIQSIDANKRHQVKLTYITSRGQWYHESWKGDVKKSGGLSTNIGVHFFDMLTWIFGSAQEISLKQKTEKFESGFLKLEKADVEWSLSIDRSELPEAAQRAGKTTYRSILIDGDEFEFSEGFTELHKQVYKDILAGRGYGAEANRAAIAIVEKIRGLT